MAEPTSPPKQPFVPPEDRPEVKLTPDTPISELRVRDLAAIVGAVSGSTKSPFEVGKTPLKDFFDKPFPETNKDFIKEIKPEKLEKNARKRAEEMAKKEMEGPRPREDYGRRRGEIRDATCRAPLD